MTGIQATLSGQKNAHRMWPLLRRPDTPEAGFLMIAIADRNE
jgi:hypothetical protein